MKYINKIILLIVLSFNVVADPVGSIFSYQGQLVENGTPANGTYDFKMDLWSTLTGGTTVSAPFVIEDVEVVNGLFSVELDFGDAPFNGEDDFLKIQVRDGASIGGYTALSPRQRINAVPYAIQSEFVENSSSPWLDITGGIGYTDDVKIGNTGTTTTSMLTVDADTDQSPVRFKIAGATRMILQNNGGTSLGANFSAPENGLRVEGITRLFGNLDLREDLQQDVENNGAIKAGLVVTCSNPSSINSSFNGVNDNSFSIDSSIAIGSGLCAIVFPFSLDDRYYVAMVQRQNDTRVVSCSVFESTTLICNTTDVNGTHFASLIHILVY